MQPGKKGEERTFDISSDELKAALMYGKNYKILFVTNALSDEAYKIEDLGNPFLFEPGEDLFNNAKIGVAFKSLEIYFR